MKINFKSTLLATLAISFFLISCSKNSDPVKGNYQSGVFVANQGKFGAGNGDVTYYSTSTSVAQQNIYKGVNGIFPGDVLQSITMDGDVGYLVLNGSNTIKIVNNNTFAKDTTFTDPKLDKPRYLQVINGKAYISVWGAYDLSYNLVKSYLLVMDTKTFQAVDTITTDIGAENLLYNGKYLFVANSYYGASSTVSVIDPVQDKRINQFTLAAGPAGMVLDINSKLWVITTGTYNNDGMLFRVNPTTFAIEQTIALNADPGSFIATTTDKKNIYYSVNNSIYKIAIDATIAPATSFIDATDVINLNALSVNPANGDIYLGDALNYNTPGMIYTYGSNGTAKTSFAAGITPSQIVFK